jgi:protein-tyrosine phosphatase
MRVVFVCAGNICRSPMAEALFRHHAKGLPSLSDVEVASAGVVALPGAPATGSAIAAMREVFGLDIRTHRARSFEPDPGDTLVLALDRWVARRIALAGGEVDLLGDAAGVPGEDVDDPYSGTDEEYRAAAIHIDRLVRALIARLARERRAPGNVEDV